MNPSKFQAMASEKFPDLSKDDVTEILAFILNVPRLELFFPRDRYLSDAETAAAAAMLAERAADRPLQYIFGEAAFRNLILKVGEGVLIPRPETEMIIDLGKESLDSPNPSICDLGTGSGAIALAFAEELPESKVVGIDSSREALEYAERNKALNNLGNVSFLLGNILSPVEESSESVGERFGKFDLIVANLPYVSRPLYEKLPRGIRGYEPENALLAGEDGLDVIRVAAKAVFERLVSGGTVIFEHSPEQSAAMSAILAENGFAAIATIKDLTGRDRFTTGGKQGGPSKPSFHPRSSR